MAILGRNKFVFKYIEELLQERNIPYYFKSGNVGLKFETIFMKLFDYYFRIKINPSDKIHSKRLKTLLKINVFENEGEISKSKYDYFQFIREIISVLTEDNFKKSLHSIADYIKESTTFNDDEKVQIHNELQEVIELWKEYSFNNLKPTLTGFKNTISLGLIKRDLRQEGICISTVHTMKGQESEIVFLLGIDDGTFPYYLAIQKGGEELSQEKNNLYVAFTRAKRFLYVSYPSERMMPWGDYKSRIKSRFLSEF